MQRRGNYGYDAPYALLAFAAAGAAAALVALTAWLRHETGRTVVMALAYTAIFSANALSFLYTTRQGKFRVWELILDRLQLRGDERTLDLGCGRGAVTVALARRLPRGTVVGVDRWSTTDQSGNSAARALENARLERVAATVRIVTADMRALPLTAGTFDVVVSSLAIHNIPRTADRTQAVTEAYRVLRPGGRIALADIRRAGHYAKVLAQLGATGVTCRRLGWRFWYGNPIAGTSLVLASKPR